MTTKAANGITPTVNKKTRQTRCERCILGHRPCDGKQPICTNCSSNKSGPKSCVYPPGQPSRSELQKIKVEEEKVENEKAKIREKTRSDQLAEQAAHRRAAGITYGFGKGMYGTVPDSWPERFGGKGGYEKMIAAEEGKNKEEKAMRLGGGNGDGAGDGGEVECADEGTGSDGKNPRKDGTVVSEQDEDQQRPKKRRRRKLPTASADDIAGMSSASEAPVNCREGFPPAVHRGFQDEPIEDIAPRAPSLGTPFDPYANPDYFNRTRKSPEAMKEMLFRMTPLPTRAAQHSCLNDRTATDMGAAEPDSEDRLAIMKRIAGNYLKSFEASLPVHVGGPHDGRPNWSLARKPPDVTEEDKRYSKEEDDSIRQIINEVFGKTNKQRQPADYAGCSSIVSPKQTE